MVVSLSAEGHLLCSYMGTDPSFFSTPKVDAREADYEQVDAEMKKLQRFIREASRTQGRTPALFGINPSNTRPTCNERELETNRGSESDAAPHGFLVQP